MSQNDFTIANQAGADFRSDVNSALQALASISSGSSAPGTTYAYMLWFDTSAGFVKQRNAANDGWISLGIPGGLWEKSQRASWATVTDGTLNMTSANDFVYTPSGADTLEFSNEAQGQRGMIWLDNSSGYAISLGSEVYADADCATAISVAGKHLLSYWCYDGTNVSISYNGSQT